MSRRTQLENFGPFEVRSGATKSEAPAPPPKKTLPFAGTRPKQPIGIRDEDLQVASAEPPRRRYECKHYETCLDLAAALNWNSFTCNGCCGEVNESLYWRAHQVRRKDSVAKALCELPPLIAVEGAAELEDGEPPAEKEPG